MRPCDRCGEPFYAKSRVHRWCLHCAGYVEQERRAERRRAARQKQCPRCETHFEASRRDAIYCGPACKQAAYRARRVTAPGGARTGTTSPVTESVTDAGSGGASLPVPVTLAEATP